MKDRKIWWTVQCIWWEMAWWTYSWATCYLTTLVMLGFDFGIAGKIVLQRSSRRSWLAKWLLQWKVYWNDHCIAVICMNKTALTKFLSRLCTKRFITCVERIIWSFMKATTGSPVISNKDMWSNYSIMEYFCVCVWLFFMK